MIAQLPPRKTALGGSGGSVRLSPPSLLRFLAFSLSPESEGCRTKKVYGLQSTPGESVESTIILNFSTFISRFAFPRRNT
ncbi:unnamed protein product [Lasius platythorax]|uniref:Uncharacterized protein n=1 Tax=Lasius platythorax TaxID=488582 RepID=A0AAV2NJT7_9HYME